MRAVIQRVSEAGVNIDGSTVGSIGRGFMVLLGVETGDSDADLDYITDKITSLRVFDDEAGKLNLSLTDVGGELLIVSQFTLLGDARHGRRPSYIAAARPEEAIPLYERAIERFAGQGIKTEHGVFGADMKVALVNDGPVTILLDSRKRF